MSVRTARPLTTATRGRHCEQYWNAFTQSSTWDAPVCIPQRPPVAPTVPGPAPPHPSLPAPVQTTAPSPAPAPTTRPRPRPRQTTTPLVATTVPDPTPAPALPASTTQATTLGVATTVPSLITATPAPALPASKNATLGAETAHEPLAMYRQLRPFVLGAVRLVGVDFHDFRADESQHLLVASAFVRALRGAGVDPTLSNGTLHMLGWCEDLRVTCKRAPANTSFPAPSIPAGRTGGAGNGAPEPVAEKDKADVTEIFLRLDLQGLFFELEDSTSVEGGGRVEQAGGGLRRGTRRPTERAWANDDAWPSPASLPMPPFQAPQVQGVYYRV